MPAAQLDRGRAWLDVALAAVSMFTVFATAYSFGTFVRPMAKEFNAGRGATALVFAITAFAYFGLGAITGPLVHKVGPRRIVAFGCTVQVLGILLTTKVHALWQAYLTYGIGVGIGVACCYVPLVAVVGGWFTTRRATAIGLSVSGIGLASLLGPPLAARLIKLHGWRSAYHVFAIATAVLLAIVVALVRTPPSFGARPPITLSSAIRTRKFVTLYIAMVLASVTLFNVFVNLVPYAEDHHIEKVKSATLISIMGGASIVGRNALAALARKVGTITMFATVIFVMGASQALWLSASSRFAQLALFAAVFGVAYGGLIALGPILLAEIFGPEQLGGLAGINYTASGIGALLGPTVCAWLVDRTGGYGLGTTIGLVLGVVGSALVLSLRRQHNLDDDLPLT
jgi:MFS family permease